MLPRSMRRHIESVYAMVRVADEVVDTYRGNDAGTLLDEFERETAEARDRCFSANLVAHAFGATARAVGIDGRQVDPFFASMRMDLTETTHDRESFDRYVHGSAEVVGEMCLAVFLNTDRGPRPLPDGLAAGARRLGAAYQKVNFLRDLAQDDHQLGRSYFPGVAAATLTDAQLADLVAECRDDLTAAEACLPGLPRRARIAVETTVDIYTRLLDEIAQTPARELVNRRVRVSNPTKVVLAVRNACAWSPTRRGAT
jgi:phytoene/squalene synthetase